MKRPQDHLSRPGKAHVLLGAPAFWPASERTPPRSGVRGRPRREGQPSVPGSGFRLRADAGQKAGAPSGGMAAFLLLCLTCPLLVAACAAPPPEGAAAPVTPDDVANWRAIDLSHSYGDTTLYWPTDTRGFDLETLAEGHTDAGYFYAAKQFATTEHGGTHLDAPVHFAEGGDDVASIPLDRLILPGIVVDVTAQAAADPDYLVTAADIGAWEEQHGPVPAGAAVLIRTGWPDRWPDVLAYLGDDTPGDASNLHFPGVGEDAARLLIEERGIGMLGIDTASVDYGQSTDFIVHQIGGAAGVPNLENVGDLSELPETGFLLVALPMKIEGGTGAPVRIVALVPR